MPKPKPTDQDFEAAVRKVFAEHSGHDLVDCQFLIEHARNQIEVGFSRRAIRKRDIHPSVVLALQRLEAAGRIRPFTIACCRSYSSSLAYLLVIDRSDVIDLENIDE
jgi:hypothetical protein